MQKFKMPLLAGGGILAAVIIYFLFFRASGVYVAVPSSSVAVIETQNWGRFADGLNNVVGSSLKETYAIKKLLDELQAMEELVKPDNALKDALSSRNTIASLHLTSANDIDFLFVTDLGSVSDNTVLNRIQASPKVKKVNIHIFKNQKIVDVQLRDGRQLSFGVKNGLMAFSFTTFLAESAIAAIDNGDNIANDKGFKSVKKSITTDINLFVNLSKAEVIFPVGLKPGKLQLLADLKQTGTWGHFDVSLKDGQVTVDGDIWTDREEPAGSKNIMESNLAAYIPANAAYVNISRADTGGSNLLSPYFVNWIGDAKAFAILEPLKEDFSDQNILVLSVRDKQKAVAGLKKLVAVGKGQSVPVDTFGGNEIYNLTDGAMLNQYWGNSLVTFNDVYFTVTDKAALFANSADVLKLVLDKIANGATADKDPAFMATGYKQYSKNTSVQYWSLQHSELLVRGLFADNSTVVPFVNGLGSVMMVTNHTSNKVSVHMVMATGAGPKAQSGLLWRTELKYPATYQPQVVQNSTTGENEIFVQDTANNIYLLNQSGAVLFTKNISEPVVSKVYQIDYYNNGKLQYIFNTTQHVFVLDRLGNDIAAYPLRLSATASGGLTVAKNSKGVCYYVPCVNGSIYGYEVNGKPLAGWSPKGGVGVVNWPVKYFTVKRNDYIAVYNTAGKFMLFDARGNLKWSVENIATTGRPVSIVMLPDTFKVMSAMGNQLIEIAADGNDNVKQLIDSANVFCATATGDTTYRYFYSTGGQLRAYNEKDEFVAATSLGTDIATSEIINWNNGLYLLAADTVSNKLFICDMTLKPVADFSYSNATAVAVTDLFGRNQWIAVTADKATSISCYRIK